MIQTLSISALCIGLSLTLAAAQTGGAAGGTGGAAPTQRSGPGGTTPAPGPAGEMGGGIQGTPGSADATPGGSGSPTPARPDCAARGANGAGFGALPRIMADEPGRRGQSSGADARAGAAGAATTGSAGAASASTIPPAPGC